MPVTLPAHAAAVLPFLRRSREGAWATALVVGASAPDFSYVVRYVWPEASAQAHDLPGFLLFSLPAGLLLLLWLEALVLPALRRTVPEVGGVQWGRFLRTGGLPRTPRGWGLVLVALGLGAATHVLWDGFTHRHQWPAEALYPHVRVPVGGRELPLARVLQHGSSLVGSLLVLGYLAWRYPRLTPMRGGTLRAFLPVLGPTLAGALGGLALRLVYFRDMGALEAQLWWAFWPTVGGALVGLTLGCGLARWRSRREPV
ncbi:MAG TPA: DUF4184 family protein [Myxococcaceae bacterium]|nr:DUF4184 family protein [Myxococcaceae bacterium]